MTFPVFASGDVLNASDMNAVGLWLVKTQTVGSAVSSVAVTSAFSTDYANYLITYNDGVGSTSTDLEIQLGSTTTGYYSSFVYGNFANTTVANANSSNTARFLRSGFVNTNNATIYAVIQNPFLTKNTYCMAPLIQANTGGLGGWTLGFLNDSTSYTGFTIFPTSGTLTGGTIRVYGYRN